MDIKEVVFISYAWGGPLTKKEWLRQQVVSHIELYGFSVFWDRDTILYGQRMDDVISKALSARPINILCICDEDYVKSAFQEGSGLHQELKLIAKIACMEDVRIIPVIIDETCKDSLPEILKGRMHLDLTMLYAKGLELGPVLASAALGATQSEVIASIALQLRKADLKEQAEKYFQKNPVELHGDPQTHKVWINNREPLLPPAWMYRVSRWVDRLSDNDPGFFSPKNGVWHWDHWPTSTGMRALGAAAVSAFFPDKSSGEEIAAIEHCGDIISGTVFSMTKRTEAFIINGNELVQHVMMADGGVEALAKLLA